MASLIKFLITLIVLQGGEFGQLQMVLSSIPGLDDDDKTLQDLRGIFDVGNLVAWKERNQRIVNWAMTGHT